MKLVKENIEFRRGQESKSSLGVGMDSLPSRTRRADELKAKIRFIAEESMPTVIEKIDEYEAAVENIIIQGIDERQIGIVLDRAKLNIPVWRIIQGNQIQHITLTEQDAKELMASLSKYEVDRDPQYTYIEIEKSGNYFLPSELKDFWKRRGWKWQS